MMMEKKNCRTARVSNLEIIKFNSSTVKSLLLIKKEANRAQPAPAQAGSLCHQRFPSWFSS
jgi:hypothetical protein